MQTQSANRWVMRLPVVRLTWTSVSRSGAGGRLGRRRASQATHCLACLVHGTDRKLKAKNELPAHQLDRTGAVESGETEEPVRPPTVPSEGLGG